MILDRFPKKNNGGNSLRIVNHGRSCQLSHQAWTASGLPDVLFLERTDGVKTKHAETLPQKSSREWCIPRFTSDIAFGTSSTIANGAIRRIDFGVRRLRQS